MTRVDKVRLVAPPTTLKSMRCNDHRLELTCLYFLVIKGRLFPERGQWCVWRHLNGPKCGSELLLERLEMDYAPRDTMNHNQGGLSFSNPKLNDGRGGTQCSPIEYLVVAVVINISGRRFTAASSHNKDSVYKSTERFDSWEVVCKICW